ncbi:DsrE family protein [Pontibacter litorisediminis]|uniref:DsrE family protein n=1 Tax=Pontibacter litorisediminis TaxID=1846260 RepID=UPI0023EC68B3|nr:DsrE family protein [Pontibacter litorisediminis]
MKLIQLSALSSYVLLLMWLTSGTSFAQSLPPLTATEKADLQHHQTYAFLAKEARHIKGAWETYQQLKNAGVPVQHFEVIAIGNAVKSITAEQELGKFIEEKSDGAFSVTVCQIALDRYQIDKKTLPSAAAVISNGYIRLYQLQAKKYLVIQP